MIKLLVWNDVYQKWFSDLINYYHNPNYIVHLYYKIPTYPLSKVPPIFMLCHLTSSKLHSTNLLNSQRFWSILKLFYIRYVARHLPNGLASNDMYSWLFLIYWSIVFLARLFTKLFYMLPECPFTFISFHFMFLLKIRF